MGIIIRFAVVVLALGMSLFPSVSFAETVPIVQKYWHPGQHPQKMGYDGLVLSGGPYNEFPAGGNYIYTKSLYNHLGFYSRVKFKVDDGGDIMSVWVMPQEFPMPIYTTRESRFNSHVLENKVWYYQQLSVTKDGQWDLKLSKGNFANQRGAVVFERSGNLADDEYAKFQKHKFMIGLAQNAAGDAAKMEIASVEYAPIRRLNLTAKAAVTADTPLMTRNDTSAPNKDTKEKSAKDLFDEIKKLRVDGEREAIANAKIYIERGVGEALPIRYSDSGLPVWIRELTMSPDGKIAYGLKPRTGTLVSNGKLLKIVLDSGKITSIDSSQKLTGIKYLSKDGQKIWVSSRAGLEVRSTTNGEKIDVPFLTKSAPKERSYFTVDRRVLVKEIRSPQPGYELYDPDTLQKVSSIPAQPGKAKLEVDPSRGEAYLANSTDVTIYDLSSGDLKNTIDVKKMMAPLYEKMDVVGRNAAVHADRTVYDQVFPINGVDHAIYCAINRRNPDKYFMVLVKDGVPVNWQEGPCFDYSVRFSPDKKVFSALGYNKHKYTLRLFDTDAFNELPVIEYGKPFGFKECLPHARFSFDFHPTENSLIYSLEYSIFGSSKAKSKVVKNGRDGPRLNKSVYWDWRHPKYKNCPQYVRLFNKVHLTGLGGTRGGDEPRILD